MNAEGEMNSSFMVLRSLIYSILLTSCFLFASCGEEKKADNTATRYTDRLSKDLERAAEAAQVANQASLKTAIRFYQAQHGSLPSELSDLVRGGFLRQIPAGEWKYDPETGEVDVP